MELTKDTLLNSGFKTNHEDRVLPTFYCYSSREDATDWRIMVTSEYLPLINVITFNCDITVCDAKGSITKHATLTDVRTSEELNTLISLCGINKQV